MKFKLVRGWCKPTYVAKYSSYFINSDRPDTYMKVNGEWVWIVSQRYGVLTVDYCELSIEHQKSVLDFLVKSAIAFYKWSYTWDCNKNATKNLEEDVNKYIARFYKDTYGDLHQEVLNGLGYVPLKEKCA